MFICTLAKYFNVLTDALTDQDIMFLFCLPQLLLFLHHFLQHSSDGFGKCKCCSWPSDPKPSLNQAQI